MIDEDYDEDYNDEGDDDNHPVRLLLPTGQPLLVRCAPFIGIKMVVRLFNVHGDLHGVYDIHDDDQNGNDENDNDTTVITTGKLPVLHS